jgi:hypothetical protein
MGHELEDSQGINEETPGQVRFCEMKHVVHNAKSPGGKGAQPGASVPSLSQVIRVHGVKTTGCAGLASVLVCGMFLWDAWNALCQLRSKLLKRFFSSSRKTPCARDASVTTGTDPPRFSLHPFNHHRPHQHQTRFFAAPCLESLLPQPSEISGYSTECLLHLRSIDTRCRRLFIPSVVPKTIRLNEPNCSHVMSTIIPYRNRLGSIIPVTEQQGR